MIQARNIQHVYHATERPALRITRSKYNALHPGMHKRTGAHQTWLKCYIKNTIYNSVIIDFITCIPERENLCMRGRVGTRQGPVPAFPQHFIISHQYRTDRHLTLCRSAFREHKRALHPAEIYSQLFVIPTQLSASRERR